MVAVTVSDVDAPCMTTTSTTTQAHLRLLEAPKYHGALVTGLQYMIKISNVNEPEIFKIALDLWHFLTSNLYETECKYNPSATAVTVTRPEHPASPAFQLTFPLTNPCHSR